MLETLVDWIFIVLLVIVGVVVFGYLAIFVWDLIAMVRDRGRNRR